MKVWRNRAKLTSVDHFENWLFILARNMIFDSFKVKVASPLEFTGAEGGVELLTPDLQTEQRDTYNSCSRASSNYRENASRCSA
ncbi:MAG: sigma-70 family RNA polymerase sigma factor [Bacteroidetes bacterium]|nr:sigma-70 family RNA polymerase sigma factor [Bacteroidota bacterium]